MGKVIQEVLRENICQLKEQLNPVTVAGLVDRLWSQKPPLLSVNEKDEILSKDTRSKQVDSLVGILHTKVDRALDILHSYLKETGCTELVASIEKSAVALEHTFPANPESTKFGLAKVEASPVPGTSASTEQDSRNNTDFPITQRMLPEIRKHLEESVELLNSWSTIKNEFVVRAVHMTEIDAVYNGQQANAKPVAIATTLEKWHSRGKSVATFNKLIAIITPYDAGIADELEANRDKIGAMKS